MLKMETRTVFACKCQTCGYEWDALKKPIRCSQCKARTWNGEDRRWNDAYRNTHPGSMIENLAEPPTPPQPQRLLRTFEKARSILNQLVDDNPCDHKKNLCVCYEKKVLAEIDRHILRLKSVTDYAKNGHQPEAREEELAEA
jgi:hypothetical protein